MTSHAVRLITDERMLLHEMTPHHPESPARLVAILDALRTAPIRGVEWRVPTEAPREFVLRLHDPAYVARVDSLRGKRERLDPDTLIAPHSVEAAYLAAGSAMQAVSAVVNGEVPTAFALVRPPGHHAERNRGMGFCIFGNIALAAAHAVAELGVARVLIVDWDVHHGNGTQHMLDERPDILVFNTHQSPLYPGTGDADEVGIGNGRGFSVNVPLPARCGNGDYAAAFREVLVPIADAFRPELVLVSAGFDAHEADPLGEMQVSDDGFADLCGIVRDIAKTHAAGKLALMLEGGYAIDALARSVHRCVEILAGAAEPPSITVAPTARGRQAIDNAIKTQRAFWPL